MEKKETAKLSIIISVEEKDMIQTYAEENDLSMSQVIRRAIKEFLNKEN